MIEAVRTWLASIVLSAFLVSLTRILIPEGNLRRVGAFTGSLILTAAILRPLVRLEPDWPDLRIEEYEAAITERMEELNAAEARDFETQVAARTEALILEQARKYGASVSAAEVTTRLQDGAPIPWAVTLYGTRNAALETWLVDALAIPPDRQSWVELSGYSTSKSESR